MRRLLVGAPFVVSAVIAQAHAWSSDVVLIGLCWSLVVQLATGPISRATPSSKSLALLLTGLFWVGPAAWLWCGIEILTFAAATGYGLRLIASGAGWSIPAGAAILGAEAFLIVGGAVEYRRAWVSDMARAPGRRGRTE